MKRWFISSLITILLSPSAWSQTSQTKNQQIAARLYQRITGVPLLPSDPRYEQIVSLVASQRFKDAAKIATDDPYFLQVTVRDFATVMSNQPLSPFGPLNDFVAMIVGVTRDDIDARELLTGDFAYVADPSLGLPAVSLGDNAHYENMEKQQLILKDSLRRVSPQWEGFSDPAGLLTTRAWAAAHLVAGTNRRALQFAFQELLCRPITTWKDVSIPDDRIRCDVPRAPSGNPQEYQVNCRGCHGPMDGLAGAFARFDFQSNRFRYLGADRIARKMTQNSNAFPFGYVTTDDSWINYLEGNTSFAWQGPTTGRGVHELGSLLANSGAFKECMTRRVFKQVCKRATDTNDEAVVQRLANGFSQNGYRLKSLFEDVATTPECLGL